MLAINKLMVFWISLLFIIAFVSACFRPSAPAPPIDFPSPTPGPKESIPGSKVPGEAEWQRIIKAAQKEGVVRIYQHSGGERREALVRGGFREKYGVPVEVISGRGNELANKIITERKAGIYQVDLFITGPDTMINQLVPNGVLDPIEHAFMLPELVDSELFKKTWRLHEHVFIEPRHLFFIFSYYSSPGMTINRNLVKPEEIKVWRDLLAPKWKGKISIQDPTISGQGGSWFGETIEILKDEDFMRALAKQEPFITRDSRLQLQWLAQGKHAIGIAAAHGVVPEFIKAGAPLSYHEILETASVTSGSSIIALVNQAPHSNAARLFINWLLSKEGQLKYSQASWQPSLRLDISVEGIDPITIPKPGVKYFNSVTPEYRRKLNDYYFDLARQIFGHLTQ